MTNSQKHILYLIVGICALALIGGLTWYFATSGGGVIDVNQQIRSTDQTHFEKEVLSDTQSVLPNGGLRPQGSVPAPQPPPAEPPVAADVAATTTSDSEGINATSSVQTPST